MWFLKISGGPRVEQGSGDCAIREVLGYWEPRPERNWQVQAWSDLCLKSLSNFEILLEAERFG